MCECVSMCVYVCLQVYICMCISMCTLWEVSEEDLSGTHNDVCSSAAQLGHREVEEKARKH